MKKSEIATTTLVTIALWAISNWFKIVVIILLIMIYSQFSAIQVGLYGGIRDNNAITGIGPQMVQGTNLILDNMDKINSKLDSIHDTTLNTAQGIGAVRNAILFHY